MDTLKFRLQRQLIANVLFDKCVQREHIITQKAWCSEERVIRFTTHFFRNQFPITDITSGKWKTGDQVMYEVINNIDSCVINCVYTSSTSIEDCLMADDSLSALNCAVESGIYTVGVYDAFSKENEKEIRNKVNRYVYRLDELL